MGDKEAVRVVGFPFSNRPNVSLRVRETVKKVRRRFWILGHLKRHRLNKEELVQVYKTNLRACIEFAQSQSGLRTHADRGAV